MINPVQSTRSAYIKLSLFVFLFTFTWAASFGLYAIWLGDKAGLNGVEIGTVFAVNGVFAVLIKPVYGYIMDKIGMKKHLLYFVCLVSALMAPFYIWVYLPLLEAHFVTGMIVGALFFSLGWYAGVAAEESYTDRFSRLYDMEFGRIRMWAALGWATASSFSGYLYNISPEINFTISSVAALCMLCVLLTLKVDQFGKEENNVLSKEKIVIGDVFALFRNRKFWTFALYIAGVAWMMFIAEQQFSRYFVTFFSSKEEGNAMFGYMSTVQSATEFFGMMLVPAVVNRIGAKQGMILTGLVISLRLIVSGLTTDPLIICLVKPLYGIEIALILVSVFKYIAEHFDKRVNATMYLLGYQAMVYVGSVVIAPPAGYGYQTIGFEHTYLIMGLIALLFTGISTMTLSACTQHRQPPVVPRREQKAVH
ncbi:TPA: oligosaccharide MFS transporter [Pluralibacter gergoviae]|uniref:MFS sugar transporter n=1 Tax=Pluralibacter gergoviae TaxID=61647 RepID=A0A0J5L2A5_PLUGE|nr:oligosaccharide MFS transporter [Pluralibacter gergoviae]ELC3071876.1 oligosaccharide MFS transporter [Pluralibacter gergoviae]ELO7478911.1 oligosaccharide MFS transporter [Pluralibacter gergoviae]ELW9440959.1 oligosaccharide MFS transporter [Pluralibacter gergoviae]KMK12945.1 MFS sugar transporter [Pluralibacter gergoviae]KMK22628.1 MFS sugar transporter [Pluralibacter gergoviae]